MFAPVRRATLLIPGTGPAHDPSRAHLFVILTDPCSAGMNLIVPICSAEGKFDPTCIVGNGDHPFLTKKSYVKYYRLNTFASATLIEQERKKVISYRGMMDEKVFALICAGVGKSPDSAPIYRRYFAEQTAK